MNYGYEPTLKDSELAAEISDYLATLPLDARKQRPYVEVNLLYPGVRVRRITHYSEEQVDEMVDKCDRIYDRVVRGIGD